MAAPGVPQYASLYGFIPLEWSRDSPTKSTVGTQVLLMHCCGAAHRHGVWLSFTRAAQRRCTVVVTEATLYDIFNSETPEGSICICRDSVSRRPLDYGYVSFYSVTDAERAWSL